MNDQQMTQADTKAVQKELGALFCTSCRHWKKITPGAITKQCKIYKRWICANCVLMMNTARK